MEGNSACLAPTPVFLLLGPKLFGFSSQGWRFLENFWPTGEAAGEALGGDGVRGLRLGRQRGGKKHSRLLLVGRAPILAIALALSQCKLFALWGVEVCFVFFAFHVSELEVHLTV